MPVARIAPTRPMRMPVTAAPPPTIGPKRLSAWPSSCISSPLGCLWALPSSPPPPGRSPLRRVATPPRLPLFVYPSAARLPLGASFLAPAPGPVVVAARRHAHDAAEDRHRDDGDDCQEDQGRYGDAQDEAPSTLRAGAGISRDPRPPAL